MRNGGPGSRQDRQVERMNFQEPLLVIEFSPPLRPLRLSVRTIRSLARIANRNDFSLICLRVYYRTAELPNSIFVIALRA